MFREDFIKEDSNFEISKNDFSNDLYLDLENSKKNLNNLYENLEFATGDLVDFYTYQIKAEEARYRFFD